MTERADHSPADLARELRRAQTKLHRSEWHRRRLEEAKDISERALRQLIEESLTDQARLEASNRELTEATRRLVDANRELQEMQASLVDSEERAQVANRVKSTFLANMSHEVRTPLNAVLGYASLLGRSGLDTQQQGLVGALEDAASALLALFENLLAYSTIELDGVSLRPGPVVPVALLEQVVGLFPEQLDAEGLELLLFVDDNVPAEVILDGARLRQVAINLVGNAVKYTDAGSITVRLLCSAQAPDAAGPADDARSVRLLLEVADTGPGFDEDSAERLFEPFVQGDSSTTRRHGGTGLGLAISRQIIAAMGGVIDVSSAPGAGACFRATVPAMVAAPAAPLATFSARICVWEPVPARRDVIAAALGGADLVFMDDPRSMAQAAERGDLLLIDLAAGGMQPHDLAHLGRARGLVAVLPMPGQRDAPPLPEHPRLEVLLLPLRPGQLRAALQRTAGRTGEHLAPAIRSGRKVLLCEDNPINQRVGALMLQSLDCDATVAANGVEALQRFSSGEYDLVLMDCQMPEMDGFEASRQIRSREQERGGERTPIVALTASALAEDREQCLNAGMDDHVAKPVTPEILASLLRRWT
jgi:two-component system sensor histidine kinase/response regulator